MIPGRLRRLFRGAERIDLGERDCHCHILPGVDDGSRSMSESLAMLRLLVESGVETVVATPHVYPGRFDNDPDVLRARFAVLQRASADAGLPIELELGAEYWLDDALLTCIEAGRVLAFGGERYVLFETATGPMVPPLLLEAVHALADAGYTPLCAHVERYAYLRSEGGEQVLADLRAAGARFQVNRTVGRSNLPGHGARGRFITELSRRGWIDEVGSDLHRPTPEGRPHSQATRRPANTSP